MERTMKPKLHACKGSRNCGGVRFQASWLQPEVLDSKDLDLLETVNLLLQQMNGIPPKHRGKTWRIAFSSPQAALWLRSIGMTEAKSFTRDWPIGLPAELVGHFVRGLMDGKGAIGQCFKHPGQQTDNLVVSLAGTGQALCQTLTQWLDAHALHYSGPMNQPTWRITIRHQASLRILYHLLYPTTEVPCLQRKRAHYIHWIEQERIRRGRPKKGVKEMGADLIEKMRQ